MGGNPLQQVWKDTKGSLSTAWENTKSSAEDFQKNTNQWVDQAFSGNEPDKPPEPIIPKTPEELALEEKRLRQAGNYGKRSLLAGSELGMGNTDTTINSLLK